jgi:hypothetical protein
MLDSQQVVAPLAFGLAENIDDRHAPFGTLVEANNVRWQKSSRLEKRRGIASISSAIVGGGNLSAGVRLIGGEKLRVFDGADVYDRTDAGWVRLLSASSRFAATWRVQADTIEGISSCDSTIVGTRTVTAWCTGNAGAWRNGQPNDGTRGGTIYVRENDTDTGAVLATDRRLVTSVHSPRFRLLAVSGGWALIHATRDTVGGPGTGIRIMVTTDTAQTSAHVASSAIATDPTFVGLDAVAVSATDFVVAHTTDPGIRVARYQISAGVPTLVASVTLDATAFATAFAVAGLDGENVFVSWLDLNTSTTRWATLSAATLAVQTAPASMAMPGSPNGDDSTLGACRLGFNSFALVASTYTAPLRSGRTQVFFVAAGVVTKGREQVNLMAVSRPFLLGGKVLLAASTSLYSGSNPQGESFVVDVSYDGTTDDSFPVVVKTSTLDGSVWANGFVSSVRSSAEVVSANIPFASSIGAGLSASRTGAYILSVLSGTSLPSSHMQSASIASIESVVASGHLSFLDSGGIETYGFPTGPNVSNVSSATTGGTIEIGSYLYGVTQEKRSAKGTLFRSSVSVNALPVAMTTATSSAVVEFTTATLGRSPIASSRSQTVLYRSVKNGSVLQRAGVEPAHRIKQDAANSYVIWPSTIFDSFSDTAGVIPLAKQPALYTSGGELEDFSPPSASLVVSHQNRLWVVTAGGKQLWFSKDWTENPGIAPGFHPVQRLDFDDSITGLATLDDKLVAFSATGIRVIYGQGPAPTGDGSSLASQEVQSEVGCTQPRSVVSTEFGIVFRSERGLSLLLRSLEVVEFGRPIQDVLRQYPVVVAATVLPADSEIRFALQTANRSASMVAVYNTAEKQWSTFTYANGIPIADAILFGGKYTILFGSGVVAVESSSSSLDDGAYVSSRIVTSWINAGGPLAYQSVRNFAAQGASRTPHRLQIGIGFEGDPAFVQTKLFATGSPVTISDDTLEAFEISVGTKRKCQMIRFSIEDLPPVGGELGNGRGFVFDSIGIDVARKRGFRARKEGTVG